MSVVTVDPAKDLDSDKVCGVAVYDMQDKVTKTEKCDSILITGVVDVLLSDTDITEIKNNNFPQISLLRRFHKVGKKTLCRCFVNFNTSDDQQAVSSSTRGLESSETHLAVMHTFSGVANVEDYDVGKPTEFQHGTGINIKGIMLWPLTDKAKTSTKFSRAAVMTHGVVTLFFSDDDLEKIVPGNELKMSFGAKDINFYALEVYQNSARVLIT